MLNIDSICKGLAFISIGIPITATHAGVLGCAHRWNLLAETILLCKAKPAVARSDVAEVVTSTGVIVSAIVCALGFASALALRGHVRSSAVCSTIIVVRFTITPANRRVARLTHSRSRLAPAINFSDAEQALALFDLAEHAASALVCAVAAPVATFGRRDVAVAVSLAFTSWWATVGTISFGFGAAFGIGILVAIGIRFGWCITIVRLTALAMSIDIDQLVGAE